MERPACAILVLALLAACEGGGSTKDWPESDAGGPTNQTAPSPHFKLDPLVGRWTIDLQDSRAGGDGATAPADTLGTTLLLSRDGTILVPESGRRGSWRRATGGVRIVLDPPPRLFDALLGVEVTDAQMRLSGPKGLKLVYQRDSLRSRARPLDESGALER